MMSMYTIDMDERRRREAPTTGFLIWRVLLKFRAAMDRALAPLGLTHARYSLLASLYALSQAGRRPSQRELADFSGLEPVFISRLARALEEGGLVERDPNPADPRAVQLRITARGLEVITSAMQIVRELDHRQLAPLGGRGSPRSAKLHEMLQALLAHEEHHDDGPDDA
jgi:MarR family transcriptional regulator, organic hydroperoxide resistance regulator